jgi:hypothetical protein
MSHHEAKRLREVLVPVLVLVPVHSAQCTVDLGTQTIRESSRTDENRNGNWARAVSIASSTGLCSTSGASGGVASFRLEN